MGSSLDYTDIFFLRTVQFILILEQPKLNYLYYLENNFCFEDLSQCIQSPQMLSSFLVCMLHVSSCLKYTVPIPTLGTECRVSVHAAPVTLLTPLCH